MMFALAAWGAVTSPVAAQDQAAEPVAMVEALVVNARTPGPPWWSVSKGPAKVWVLGLSGGQARDARWDIEPYERRLRQSGRLIRAETAATVYYSVKGAATREPWFDSLTPAERDRLTRAAALTPRSLEFYARLRPNIAALLLYGEIKAAAGISSDEPEARLLSRAKALKARDLKVGGRLKSDLRRSLRADGADDLVCLNWVTQQALRTGALRERGEAWGRGDVRALVSGPMAYDPCDESMTALNAAQRAQNTAMVRAIAATLERGQGAVALVDLAPLLMQNGVLDQLRAKGFTVRTPGD